MNISNDIGNKRSVAIWTGNIGVLYTKTGQFSKAQDFLCKALAISDSICNLSLQQDHHKYLYKLYDTLARIADNNLKIPAGIANVKELWRLLFHHFKKELELAAERERRQQIMIWFIVAAAVAVAVIAIVILRSLRITQRQKRIIESQKRLVEQKQEEILASIRYARRIQKAMMPTEKYMERILGTVRKK